MVSSIGSTLVTLFYFSQLLIISICMHSSNARLLLLLHANHKPSSTKPLHFPNSLQILENNEGGKRVEKARVSAEIKRLSTENEHHDNNMKIDDHHGVYNNKEGNEMVEDHKDLLKGKNNEKVLERPPSSSQHHGKQEDAAGLKSDDIVVMDYQPPHRKTPIHNK
uniref:uncharacterized protein LOC122606185 n=1 Tax=Erigeron canadensis TaxID=72917 RepID=UPI001CB970D3|nr:uncharacterized protein LOC122606185 [Erigeron canadensis]